MAESCAMPRRKSNSERRPKISAPTIATAAPTAAVFTVEAFAEAIAFHPESVRRSIRRGQIYALKFGPTWRIPAAEVQRILAHGLPCS